MQGNLRNQFRFAMMGFAVTAFFVVYQLATEPGASRDHTIMISFVVLCPPSLLVVPVIDAEVGTRAFYFVWGFIAILNAALYGAISALVRQRKRSV